jgi:nucleoprotein TPR
LKQEKASLQSETETLRKRNDSLEESNRSAFAIINTKNTANAELNDEAQKHLKKIGELKQEVTALSVATQEAQAAASSAEFRQKSVEQQLELAQKNNEWLENELKLKSAEALRTRKEKGARIAELQRQNEEANARIESLERTEQDLRRQLADMQRKLEEKINEVQQLQERAVEEEERFKQDQESHNRLLELQKEQAKTHKKRLHDVELRFEQVKYDSINEVRKVQQLLEKEKEEHAQTVQQLQELQGELDQLQAAMASQQQTRNSPGAVPSTPRPNGSVYGRPSSPFGTPGSFRGKASQRASDTIGELYHAKAQLAAEKRRNKQLQEELDDLAALLEAKAPEIEEANSEVERLRNEAVYMSEMMEQSYQERDLATKAARKAESTASSSQAEVKILLSQIRDLSTQVHVLIFNIQAQEKGVDHLTEEEAAQYERVLRGEVSEGALDDLSQTQRFITERFVTFKDVHELQAKNQELLRMTRELADKMENEEAIAEKHQAADDHKKVDELRVTVKVLQDDVKSITVRMKSYMAERDMFRRMLQHKASAAEINQALGNNNGEGSQREVLASIENGVQAGEAELVNALRELQGQFDSYRNDQDTDRKTMRDQIDSLSAENSSLKIANANVKSHLTVAEERFKILQSNFEAVQHENKELQKRNQTLSETSAKQDIRTQQVAEELVEVKGLMESMRNESSNLKAEKSLWKSIHDRLELDNKGLVTEKARLNALLSSQQNLQNERDLAANEAKRRLEAQVDTLENELNSTKRKLTSEIDASRQAQLVKEHDTKEAQKRIDELASTLNELKQENVALKTSRDHLQARVDELTIELRNAEERSNRLRPLPTPRSQPTADQASNNEAEARIQELEAEVDDLRGNLELANTHLDNAKQQMEEYKQLSQDVEEELSSFTTSQEQYRDEMDALLSTKDNTINELNQRVEALTTELANSTSELNRLRDSQAETARKAEEKERILNEEVSRLKEEEEQYKEAARDHMQDLRAQAEIAAQAQQACDEELVKHAKAREELHALRAEYNTLKTQATTWKVDAESAKHALAQSEGSWDERRQHLEQEISDIKTRWNDANAQNKLLHKQLETLGQQITEIQQARSSAADASDAVSTSAATADSASEGIRELNAYLRREKEILEVQFDMKTQEANSLRQKLEYAQSQLDETRVKLEQERRSQADGSRASMTHKELMDKLTELNLYKESNVTLRNQNLRTEKQLTEKSAKIEELEAKIQPLEARVTELESVQAFKEEEIKQLQEDRERWQKRTESILTKYGQADPAELEKLKETIETLTAERDALKESVQSLQAQVDEAAATLEAEKAKSKESKDALTTQFKTRFGDMRNQRNTAQTEKAELQTELDSVKEKLESLEKELEAARNEKTTLEERNRALEEQVQAAASQQEPATESQPQPQDSELAQELEDVKQQLEALTNQKAEIDMELEDLRARLETAVSERDQALAQAAERMSPAPINGASTDAPAVNTTIVNLGDEQREALQAQIAAAEAKAAEFEQKAKELEEQIDEKVNSTVKARSEKMKDTLNKKLKESRENLEKEKAQLEEDFKVKLEQERAVIMAEIQSAPPQNNVPATPAKAQQDQPPPTPNVPSTPASATSAFMDLSSLSDQQTRELLTTNPTVKSILAANIKKKVEAETKKVRDEVEGALKAEYEKKIASARESATELTTKKSALKLNMMERQVGNNKAKLAIVETAAANTPQKPVIEVWFMISTEPPKASSGPPATAPAVAAQSSAASSTSSQIIDLTEEDYPVNSSNILRAAPTPSEAAVPTTAIPQPGKPAKAQSEGAAAAANPFASSTSQPPPSGIPNPFAPAPQQATNQAGQPQPQGLPYPGPARTGIPVPSRGGANAGARGGRGGQVYQHPGNRAPGGGNQNQQQGGGRGGRGGYGNRNSTGLNPNAGDFNPGASGGAGNKRPRGNDGDSGHGGGAGNKRQRGGAGGQ